jgi:hypothetical protein
MLKSEESLITQSNIIITSAFELINNIIHEYVDNLSVYNIRAFLDILESFSIHKGDINTSFVALTMFWNVANLIEKYEKLNKLVIIIIIEVVRRDKGKRILFIFPKRILLFREQ